MPWFNPAIRAPQGLFDLPPQQPRGPVRQVAGITRDASGNALAGCTVRLFRTATDVEVDVAVSDAGGNYAFNTATPADRYYVVAYLPGAPDRAGTTVNSIVGSQV